MINQNNPGNWENVCHEMQPVMNHLDEAGEKINTVVKNGKVTYNLGQVLLTLLTIDYVKEEGEVLIRNGYKDQVPARLTELRFHVEGLYSLFVRLPEGGRQVKDLRSGLIVYSGRIPEISPIHKEVFSLVKQRYHETVDHLSGRIAA